MKLRSRIGIDVGKRLKIEDAIIWANKNEISHIDIQLDSGENLITTLDNDRCLKIRESLNLNQIKLALHTSSAVNVAEYAPFVSESVDLYLKNYIDISSKLNAEWIVVHAGYHFTNDIKLRMKEGKARLQRMAEYAEKNNALILLENLNKEPEDAEVHYLANTIEEWKYYWDINSPAFKLSFTANHAHLVNEGIEGFVDSLDFNDVYEVRLADCFRNGKELHLPPGKGDIDFGAMFTLIEKRGFKGTYTNAFGSLQDMLDGREYLVNSAIKSGLNVN